MDIRPTSRRCWKRHFGGWEIAWALALIFGAWPRGAAAQQIDTYLDPAVPGFSTEPGVTVTSRLHPDYDYPAVRLGSFVVQPEIVQSGGYESNIAGSAQAHGGAVLESRGQLDVNSDWGRDSLGGSLVVDGNVYPGLSSQSYTNVTAQVGGTYEIGRGALYAGVSHVSLNQTSRDLDVPDLKSPIAYRIDSGQISYRAPFSLLALTPGVQVSVYDFDNGIVQGVPYRQTYRDRTVFSPSVTAEYELAPLRRLVFVVKDADADYRHAIAGTPGLDFNDVSFMAGIDYGTEGPVRLRALAGYERRTFASAAYRTIAAPVVEASVIWTPSQLTTVTGTAARYIEDSAAETTTGYTETALKLAVAHEYLRNVQLQADAGFYDDSYPDGGGSQQFYALGAGVTWLLNRHMRLALRYDFTSRQSGDDEAPVSVPTYGDQALGGSYRDQHIALQLSFGL